MKKSLLVMMLGAALAFTSCTPKKAGDENPLPTAANADENMGGDSDNGKAMGLETVHFPYDAFTLTDEAKNILKANANILKDKKSMKIQIEGHCDQRGGIQYNIALGEKRANAVKRYLHSMGIANDRLSVISFGKEKLLDRSESEDAYARNRRANFVVTSN